jgi:hypothetical protein
MFFTFLTLCISYWNYTGDGTFLLFSDCGIIQNRPFIGGHVADKPL